MRVRFSLPLLSGFFATYLPSHPRPLHTVAFLTPINEDPSAESTAETCLRATKELCLDTRYQEEAVVVVDEKIYRSCVKVRQASLLWFIAYLSPCLGETTASWRIRSGHTLSRRFSFDEKHNDCHMGYSRGIGNRRNTRTGVQGLIVTSSAEVGYLVKKYVSLTFESSSVHHFNKSLRCCKLPYTALAVLLLETFLATAPDHYRDIQSNMEERPSEFCRSDIKQKWFSDLLGSIERSDFHDQFHAWCIRSAANNSVFSLWSFVLFRLLEPLIELYTSIRTGNFAARNGALSRIAPLFFSTNHRNYARLSAQHLVDLRTGTSYIIERLSRSFAVNRSNRPFSCKLLHSCENSLKSSL